MGNENEAHPQPLPQPGPTSRKNGLSTATRVFIWTNPGHRSAFVRRNEFVRVDGSRDVSCSLPRGALVAQVPQILQLAEATCPIACHKDRHCRNRRNADAFWHACCHAWRQLVHEPQIPFMRLFGIRTPQCTAFRHALVAMLCCRSSWLPLWVLERPQDVPQTITRPVTRARAAVVVAGARVAALSCHRRVYVSRQLP